MTRGRLTAAAALVALAVAGCGGDDDGGGGSTAPAAASNRPAAKQPIVAQLPAFNRAIATQSCPAFTPLEFSIVRPKPPGAPAGADECKGRNRSLESLRGERFVRAAQFGTGGVMESGQRAVQYTIWALDGDGRFRYTNVSGAGPPQIGKPFTKRDEAERLANRFLDAVREGDCRKMEPLFNSRASRLVATGGSTHAACQSVLKGKFLAPAVRKTPDIRVEVLGGTELYGFVGVPTRDIYFTMLVSESGTEDLRVLDTLPATPVELPG